VPFARPVAVALTDKAVGVPGVTFALKGTTLSQLPPAGVVTALEVVTVVADPVVERDTCCVAFVNPCARLNTTGLGFALSTDVPPPPVPPMTRVALTVIDCEPVPIVNDPGYVFASRELALALTATVSVAPPVVATPDIGVTVSQLPDETTLETPNETGPPVEVTVTVWDGADDAAPGWPLNVSWVGDAEIEVVCASAVSAFPTRRKEGSAKSKSEFAKRFNVIS
jgi:hypothetical protein